MDHLKNKKFVVLCLCMLFFVLITMGFIGRPYGSSSTDEELIVKTFNSSGAEFQGLNVRGWKLLDSKAYNGASPVLLKKLSGSLFKEGFTSTVSNADDGLNTITMRGRAAKDVIASLTIAEQTGNLIKHKERYLLLSLKSSNPASLRLMKEMYNKIMRDDTNKSVVIYGYIKKKLSPLETNIVVEKMAESARLQKVETMAGRGMVSVSGYSPNVRNVLTLDNKWVNINMALRYNSLAKRTMVYVGSPVITIEY